MPGVEEATNEAATQEPEGVERDPSAMSESERDQFAWDALGAGDDPRSINSELSKMAAGREAEGDGKEIKDGSQDVKDDAGEEGGGVVTLTPEAGDESTETPKKAEPAPADIVLARRRLSRDHTSEEIAAFEQGLGAAGLVTLAGKSHARNAEIDRMNNQKHNPEAKGNEPDANIDGADDEAESDASDKIEALRDEGMDDEADAFEHAVQNASKYREQLLVRDQESWLQTAVSSIEAAHPELATDEGKVSLAQAMSDLSGTGEYSTTEESIGEWVKDAATLCEETQRSRTQKLADPDADPLDGQPDFLDASKNVGRKPLTKEDRDAQAFRMLGAGMDPEEINRRLSATGS